MTILDSFLGRRRFILPAFDLAPLDFDVGVGDELLLDDVVTGVGTAAAATLRDEPLPTAGELHASIERHLRSVMPCDPPIDAADELRSALAELRQSLG
jgi:hypothetical protein